MAKTKKKDKKRKQNLPKRPKKIVPKIEAKVELISEESIIPNISDRCTSLNWQEEQDKELTLYFLMAIISLSVVVTLSTCS